MVLIFFITAALNQSKAYSTDLIVKLATNGLWIILLVTVYPWLKKITKNKRRDKKMKIIEKMRELGDGRYEIKKIETHVFGSYGMYGYDIVYDFNFIISNKNIYLESLTISKPNKKIDYTKEEKLDLVNLLLNTNIEDREIKKFTYTEIKIIDYKKNNYVSNIRKIYLEEKENGEGSDIKDSYHTMSELYFNRLVLFSVICETYNENSWKSKQHSDGTMFDGFFIVGITTPQGDYAYHFQLKYWDLFNVKEIEYAPSYDGHQSSDIGRLFSLIAK